MKDDDSVISEHFGQCFWCCFFVCFGYPSVQEMKSKYAFHVLLLLFLPCKALQICVLHSTALKSAPLFSEASLVYRFCKRENLHTLQNRFSAQNHIKYDNA